MLDDMTKNLSFTNKIMIGSDDPNGEPTEAATLNAQYLQDSNSLHFTLVLRDFDTYLENKVAFDENVSQFMNACGVETEILRAEVRERRAAEEEARRLAQEAAEEEDRRRQEEEAAEAERMRIEMEIENAENLEAEAKALEDEHLEVIDDEGEVE